MVVFVRPDDYIENEHTKVFFVKSNIVRWRSIFFLTKRELCMDESEFYQSWQIYYYFLCSWKASLLFSSLNSWSSFSKLAPLEAILFDIDGTLCDSDPLHFYAFRELLQEVVPSLLIYKQFSVIPVTWLCCSYIRLDTIEEFQ